MKKFLLISLITVLSLSVVGCKNNVNDNLGGNSGDAQTEISGEVENNDASEEVELPGETEVEVSGDITENPGETENVDPNSLTATIANIAAAANFQLQGVAQQTVTTENSEYFIGLTPDVFTADVAEAVSYESMMTTTPKVAYLIKANDVSKVATLKQTIFDNADPRKWICVNAEKVVVVDSNEYILFAMAEVAECDALVQAFGTHFGNTLGTVLEETVEF